MSIFLFAFFWLAIAWLFHLLLWRLTPRVHGIRALIVVFLIFLSAGLFFDIHWVCFVKSLGIWSLLHASLVYISGALVYINLYSLIEDNSPSLTIILFTQEGGVAGRARQEYECVITDEKFIRLRLDALIQDRLILETSGLLRLTSKGVVLAKLLKFSSNILGLSPGG